MTDKPEAGAGKRWSRREFLSCALAGGALGVAGAAAWQWYCSREPEAETFIASVADYGSDLAAVILAGMRELGVSAGEVRGKRILLKPNLVEPHRGAGHINTHPLVVRGAVEAFLSLGAAEVLVGEGPGHCRDTLLVLEQSGLQEVLRTDRVQFVDLNFDDGWVRPNGGGLTNLDRLTFPSTLRRVDWIVSMPKLKTHHWAGVTLSMKNLFGVMPGIYYGWPKNVLHVAGIEKSILDINATLRPHFAIADGIVGMEGDGPIMGEPRHAGVLVLGRNLAAVDATSARVMGIDPLRVPYLAAASGWLGTVREDRIRQRGENIAAVRTDFVLLDGIAAQRGLRLG